MHEVVQRLETQSNIQISFQQNENINNITIHVTNEDTFYLNNINNSSSGELSQMIQINKMNTKETLILTSRQLNKDILEKEDSISMIVNKITTFIFDCHTEK